MISSAKVERLKFLRNSAPEPSQEARWAGYVTIGGREFPLMSLLSDDLIEMELACVTKSQREQCSANLWTTDTRLGAYQTDKKGRRKFVWTGATLPADELLDAQRSFRRAFVPPAVEWEIIWTERARTYATGRRVECDGSYGPFVADFSDKTT